MFVVKNINNNNSSLRSTDLQVVGNISAANLASGECTIDKLILTDSIKVNDISLSLNQLEKIKFVDISGSLTASLYDLNQKIWNVNTALLGGEQVWIPDISGIKQLNIQQSIDISENKNDINK